MSVCIYVCLFICLPVYMSACKSVCLYICLPVYLTACLPTYSYMPACLPAIYLSVYLSACLSNYLLVYISICLSIYLSACLSNYLLVYLTICLSIYLSACLSICLPVYLSICLSNVYLSIYLPVPIPGIWKWEVLLLVFGFRKVPLVEWKLISWNNRNNPLTPPSCHSTHEPHCTPGHAANIFKWRKK